MLGGRGDCQSVGEVISGVTFACDSAAAIKGMYLNVGLVSV